MTDAHTQESTGSFYFNGTVSGTLGTDVKVFSVRLDLEFEVSAGVGMSVKNEEQRGKQIF